MIELVSAFSTFPNQGIHIPYRMIHRIIDRYGRVVEDNSGIEKEEVLSAHPDVAECAVGRPDLGRGIYYHELVVKGDRVGRVVFATERS